jgi:hypothetical protein
MYNDLTPPVLSPEKFSSVHSGLLGLCCIALAAVAFAGSEGDARLPVWIASAALYGLPLLVFPHCRPQLDTPLCPRNLALLLFFLQLVVVPVSIMTWGINRGQLPELPSRSSTTLAALLSMLAYASFCLANQLAAAYRGATRSTVTRRWNAPRWLPLACLGIGLIGMAATFPTFSALTSYYTQPGLRTEVATADVPATFQGAAGTFLRPFLAFGLILLWAEWVDRSHGSRVWKLAFGTILCIGAQALSNLSFHYNRASVVYPAVAILAAFSLSVRRLPTRTLFILALVAGFLVPLFGTYRSSSFPVGDILRDESVRASLLQKTDWNTTLQVYGGAPQLNAYLLDGTGWGRTLYWGRTLVASALYPVPILGKPFRESSGVVLFNRLVYANESLDQIIPFTGELFLNFHVLGVIGGFGLLGWAVAVLQEKFGRSSRALDAYICFFAALWLSSLIFSSVAAVGQIFVYMFWPIYGYLLLRWASQRKRRLNLHSIDIHETLPAGQGQYRSAIS